MNLLIPGLFFYLQSFLDSLNLFNVKAHSKLSNTYSINANVNLKRASANFINAIANSKLSKALFINDIKSFRKDIRSFNFTTGFDKLSGSLA